MMPLSYVKVTKQYNNNTFYGIYVDKTSVANPEKIMKISIDKLFKKSWTKH